MRAPGRRRLWPVVAAVAIAALAAGAFWWQRARAAPLTERDVVVPSDFTNTTGEPVFDGTLRAAFSIQLEQSPFLKIMSDDQMGEGLRLMERPPDARITAEVGREICQRFGEKAVIHGSIAALERPLDQVTTSSLDALQAFALGAEAMTQGSPIAAIRHLERATALDENFAMAWWYLGSAYQNAGASVPPGRPIERAFALRDRLSERERLSIEADRGASTPE